jgi:hypothetical protein
MSIAEKVKERISELPLGSEEKMLLRGVLGELARNAPDGEGERFVKQWIKKNEEQRARTRRNVKEAERIDFETDLLRSLLED